MVSSLLNSSRHIVRNVCYEENSIFEKISDFELIAIYASVSFEISRGGHFSNWTSGGDFLSKVGTCHSSWIRAKNHWPFGPKSEFNLQNWYIWHF